MSKVLMPVFTINFFRNWRFAAYRSYIYWVYGKLERRKRKVIPSCVVIAIRKAFSVESGVYEGYHELPLSFAASAFP